jgi:hypothetical protein
MYHLRFESTFSAICTLASKLANLQSQTIPSFTDFHGRCSQSAKNIIVMGQKLCGKVLLPRSYERIFTNYLRSIHVKRERITQHINWQLMQLFMDQPLHYRHSALSWQSREPRKVCHFALWLKKRAVRLHTADLKAGMSWFVPQFSGQNFCW